MGDDSVYVQGLSGYGSERYEENAEALTKAGFIRLRSEPRIEEGRDKANTETGDYVEYDTLKGYNNGSTELS